MENRTISIISEVAEDDVLTSEAVADCNETLAHLQGVPEVGLQLIKALCIQKVECNTALGALMAAAWAKGRNYALKGNADRDPSHLAAGKGMSEPTVSGGGGGN